jgi:hypothetical protein
MFEVENKDIVDLAKPTILKQFISNSSVAELANVSAPHPRDPETNLDIERKYFLILFVYLLIIDIDQQCWIPQGMSPKSLNHNM